ncbi:hypothetical protein AVEN_89963-1 [Araneus ventricosus]|uniref:Uncharacterized protein n=1 Tax=Araneus ventricosus TaxID=182803 RepID=A0A4Y2VA13_ARAVE|nr:hypothetical protein AVEN_89963-1 [Araneus ventricosus]
MLDGNEIADTIAKNATKKERVLFCVFEFKCLSRSWGAGCCASCGARVLCLGCLRGVKFPSREHRSHEKESAVPFDVGGKQQDSSTGHR